MIKFVSVISIILLTICFGYQLGKVKGIVLGVSFLTDILYNNYGFYYLTKDRTAKDNTMDKYETLGDILIATENNVRQYVEKNM